MSTAVKLFNKMILIEFKRAFDSVHRNYLVATLVDLQMFRSILFRPSCLYTRVVTPYGLTNRIPVRQGVLQGDTLAAYL